MFVRSGPTPRSYVAMTKLYEFYSRILHPKAIAGKAAEHFFFIIDVRIRQKTVVLIFWCLSWFFFSEKIFFALRKKLGQSIFRKLFILFTEINLTEIVSVPT